MNDKKSIDIFEAVSQKWSVIHERAQFLRWCLRLADSCFLIEFDSTDSSIQVLWPRCSDIVKQLQRLSNWNVQTSRDKYWVLFVCLFYSYIRSTSIASTCASNYVMTQIYKRNMQSMLWCTRFENSCTKNFFMNALFRSQIIVDLFFPSDL